MKNLVILVGIVLCMNAIHAQAQVKAPLNELQPDKPSLFTDFPEKSIINRVAIAGIFEGISSGNVKFSLENNRQLVGIILEKQVKSEHVITANIRLPQYDQALFTISRTTDSNGNHAYSGTIIHIKYGDVLILKEDNGQLYLLKEKRSLFLVE